MDSCVLACHEDYMYNSMAMLKSVGIYLLFIVELILIKPWLDAENSFQYIYISNLNSTTNNSTVY
jgi:hypothetical protein